MFDVIGKLLQDNNMPDTPTARAIYRKMLDQRPWVGLTEDDIAQAMCRADAIFTGPMQFKFAKELEAKLKEKNDH